MCKVAIFMFNALVFRWKIPRFLQLFMCEILTWFCGKKRFFWRILTSQTLLKWLFWLIFTKMLLFVCVEGAWKRAKVRWKVSMPQARLGRHYSFV